jgi:hypothetical protein
MARERSYGLAFSRSGRLSHYRRSRDLKIDKSHDSRRGAYSLEVVEKSSEVVETLISVKRQRW